MRLNLSQIREEVLKGNVNALYKSGYWIAKRLDILKRDHYECQRCKRINHKLRRGNIVHHIIELRYNVDLMLEDDNLETVCSTCHNELHPDKLIKYKKKKFTNDERW